MVGRRRLEGTGAGETELNCKAFSWGGERVCRILGGARYLVGVRVMLIGKNILGWGTRGRGCWCRSLRGWQGSVESAERSANRESGDASSEGGGPTFHFCHLGSCAKGAPQDWSGLAIGAAQIAWDGARTNIAPVSRRRIAFVFEVFSRSILSWGRAERQSVAARERFRRGAVGIQGIGWRPNRPKCGRPRWMTWARIAGIYGDRASIGRAWLPTFPGSIDRSRRQFLASDSQRG